MDEYRRGVSAVPGVRRADETARMPVGQVAERLSSWRARDVKSDGRTAVFARTSSSDIVYGRGFDDGARVWQRIAAAGIGVSALAVTVAGVVLVQWWGAVS